MSLFVLTRHGYDPMENHHPRYSQALGLIDAVDQSTAMQEARAWCASHQVELETHEGRWAGEVQRYPYISVDPIHVLNKGA